MTELEKVICSSLNLFCFLNIWNEPESEYRVNIKPRMITEHSRSGAVIMNGRRIDLPRSNEPFYLYAISIFTYLCTAKVSDDLSTAHSSIG